MILTGAWQWPSKKLQIDKRWFLISKLKSSYHYLWPKTKTIWTVSSSKCSNSIDNFQQDSLLHILCQAKGTKPIQCAQMSLRRNWMIAHLFLTYLKTEVLFVQLHFKLQISGQPLVLAAMHNLEFEFQISFKNHCLKDVPEYDNRRQVQADCGWQKRYMCHY
jgi:hypothetical protein